ncbi:MAG: DNA/RNA non-specific endonuclease [Eubacteriales bacterium]|nr:DNA/RNA non-specific endonuclease [Eubacteriales bacterium]
MKQKSLISVLSMSLVFMLLLSGCSRGKKENIGEDSSILPHEAPMSTEVTSPSDSAEGISSELEERSSDGFIQSDDCVIPVYTGIEVVQINDNIPFFQAIAESTEDYVKFSELDSLGRCGIAEGYIGSDILPTVERGSIGMIKPSGWQTVKYPFIDGKYLYNRCHLIAYELCGVNDDPRNLMTGTRHLNLDGMLNIENQVCWYVKNSGNHVRYRVTPWYEGNNLVAAGVQIEALSVEDSGAGICLNIFCFNVQPGVIIDYSTGDSFAETTSYDQTNGEFAGSVIESEPDAFTPSDGVTYVLNTNTYRFHFPDCKSVQDMKEKNRKEFFGPREELIEDGYVPCGRCNP